MVPAIINAVINGVIAYYTLRSEPSIPLTLDLISTQQHTVWGQGVSLTFALGIILSLIASKVFASHVVKQHPELQSRVRRPLFPTVTRIAINNAMVLFGWFVAIAVLWQRLLGTIQVTPTMAAVLIGVLAGVITVVVEVRTKRALLQPV